MILLIIYIFQACYISIISFCICIICVAMNVEKVKRQEFLFTCFLKFDFKGIYYA